MKRDKIGVILLNMGGPTNLDEVRPFLYNIFSDREIIRLGPALLQKPIAWLIARKRAPKSAQIYQKIGGGSPIAEITRKQQQALQEALEPHGSFVVTTGMRYWHPTAREALETLRSQDVTRLIGLSLYPHYSCATAGSSLKELKRNLRPDELTSLIEIGSWPTQPGYISCLAEKITSGLKQFQGEAVQILYSAHSLPVSFINDGDPYVEHLEETIKAVEQITGQTGRICYQSRSGPVEWLAPATPEAIVETAQSGAKNILMVPISFVSDHVETLYEINMQYRELAEAHGVRLEPSESLNCDPVFIEALKDIVLAKL
ncbi:MAG: ferrochelatase [Desulfobulbaceae bacterium]|nr:MAG: ferrochelatase [Desulfobulbaceae bacterium]